MPETPPAIAPSSFEPLTTGSGVTRRRIHPLRWIVLGVASVFLVIMAFLFTARSVQILVEAEGEPEVEIRGGLHLPFGDRYLMRPGEYRVEATATGYHPLASDLAVSRDDSQVVELVMRPLPGRITIDSDPPGAAVAIDGEVLGITPLVDLPVEAGDRRLQLELERYLPLERDLKVTGRDIQQQLALALAPAWAEVSIDSLPAGATVLVDGEAVGETPATLEVLQGERQIMLQKTAFADWEQTLEITAGQPIQLERIELQPANGVLQLESTPSGANVTVDGEFEGQTPLTLELSPGRSHRINLSRPGYRRYNTSVELAPGASDSRSVRLVAMLGEVQFRISPPNAVLRVDGRPRGKGSQTLSLPAFEHSVEVALEGYNPERRRITPRPGLSQLMEITLQTEQEARLARIKPEVTSALGQTLLLFSPQESGRSEFTMGASRREPGRRSNEVLHPVALRRMFYLQTTEVSNAQFRLFQPTHNSGQVEGNSLNREHQPAVQVSWQQAAQFCNWLSRREGLPLFYRETNGIVTGFNPNATGYRLPTEAEWAWAARVSGEQVLKFPWGDKFPPTEKVENYADNTSAHVTGRILNGYTDGHVVSAPVASYAPSAKGLYDLGGNVAEWVHDVYSIPAANGPAQIDPLGPQTGDNFVIRGASWSHSKIAELRLSHRDYGQAGRDDVGFRLARYAE